jgi:hypothetical protein
VLEEVERAAALGGTAAAEARVKEAVDALWRSFFAGEHDAVVQGAEKLLTDRRGEPVIHYLLGLSLHAGGARLKEALTHYDGALAKGFDPAWTRFHRGRLRLELGDHDGVEDLKFAIAKGGDAGKEAERVLATVPH